MSNALDSCNPMIVYQRHLDILSDALIAGDFQAFKSRMHIPHMLLREDDILHITSSEQMKQLFDAFHRNLMGQRVTAQVRIAKNARFKADNLICGNHDTHLMSGGTRIVAPYPNRVRLQRIDGVWLETASSNAIQSTNRHTSIPKVGDRPQLREFPAHDPKRTSI